jgi:RNA polymerase sigma-70 factor (ECF subfamily)
MPNPAERAAPDLARYRSYLRLLAAIQLDPRLARKVDPSDVAQLTLAEAYRSLPAFRGTERQLPAWLRQVLTNTLRDEVRRLKAAGRDVRRERQLDQSLAESSAKLERALADPGSSPEQRAAREEELVRLAGALEALPDDQRTAVELKQLRGWTVAEVSQHMGRSEAAVAGLLRRGMERLRGLLADLM